MKPLLKKYREIILYVIFGGLTTLVNWLAYWFLSDLLSISYLWSTAIAQIIAILFAYVTNRVWVFKSRVNSIRGIVNEVTKFFSCRAISFILDLICMYIGVDILCVNDMVMKLLANVIVIILNYILSKLFVFKKSEN